MVTKKEFEEAEERYLRMRKRFRGIKPGQIVWDCIPKYGEIDYHPEDHPAVVKAVNVDECYVDVIDVSDRNRERRYSGFSFYTEQQFICNGFSKAIIEEAHRRYKKTIESVLRQAKKLK